MINCKISAHKSIQLKDLLQFMKKAIFAQHKPCNYSKQWLINDFICEKKISDCIDINRF